MNNDFIIVIQDTMKKGIIILILLIITLLDWAQFNLHSEKTVTVACDQSEENVVHTALKLFARDCQAVFSAQIESDVRVGDIIVGTLGKSPLLAKNGSDISVLEGKKQAFLLMVLPNKKLLIVGSDSHGTAYGIMELSRLIGVQHCW